jgi:tocopherol O-methyltransferase
MPAFDASQVRRYYDRQTAGFVTLGQGGTEGAIHRAVWGPGVTTRAQAFHFVDDQIAEALADGRLGIGRPSPGARQIPRADRRTEEGKEHRGFSPGAPLPHVVDLGCGVGGSLTYLASRLPIRGTGITLSPVQAHMATERVRALGLADRVTCVEGDFTHLPAGIAPADAAFAIESFVHGPAPAAFFAECARLIRPGGALIICDDLRRPTTDPRAAPALQRFQRGWHVNTLITRAELIAHARAAGFAHEHSTDLTPWLELRRPRDRAIAAFVALCGWLPLARTPIAHVVGGSALQTCLARGWVGYELAWFRRAG